MSENTMDAAGKQAVKDALIARARAEFDALQENVQIEDDATRLDQDSSFSVDDQSQADAAGDLSGLFQQSRERQQENLDALEALDMATTDTVRPGAIVGLEGAGSQLLNGTRFVVGIVADSLEHDGVTYAGLSADSPLFAAIDGLGLGDTFTFREVEHRVDFLA